MRFVPLCPLLFLFVAVSAARGQTPRPNIVLIVADDLGYGDLGVHGGKDVVTPNIDAIAAAGMRFTNAYATGCVCSPSRVGLLTGRHQCRTGHDSNPHRQFGLDLSEVTLAQRLKAAGYATGMVGKWHLGDSKEQNPLSRGFDEFYGILEHGIGPAEKGNREIVVHRGWEETATPEDHTTAFGREASAFIERHKTGPFFIYLPFTAVHSPHVSPASYQQKFAHIADPRRRRYVAMLSVLDDMIGGVMGQLRKHNMEERTLVLFMADNGGPDGAPNSGGLRGGKWTLWEGGIRSPLFVSWKGHIPAGQTCDVPVTGLDVVPSALGVAGIAIDPSWKLDGLSLLALMDDKAQPARDALYWRFGPQFAVRQANWKLVKPSLADEPMLFDLATDAGESKNLSAAEPERVQALTALWNKWNAGNIAPRWQDERWNGQEARKARKKAKKAAP
jgi:arylsulfatase A-like enzyme